MYMGEVLVYIEAKGTAEKIFLVLTLVPVFGRHFFVPLMCRKVYTSVWGVHQGDRERSYQQARVPPLQLPSWWVTLGQSPNLCPYL